MDKLTLTREDIEKMKLVSRDWAIWAIDGVHGYTCEHSSDPQQHADEYDQHEADFKALCELALQALSMTPRPPIEKPRRKIVVLAKLEADDWDAMLGTLRGLETQIAMHGSLSASSVSGGYSTGHIVVCDEDGSMTHVKWAEDLNAYLTSLPTPGET
jgi:hypothetical protein